MAKLNQIGGRAVNVDLIRTVAMIGVILLHASGRFAVTSEELRQMNQQEVTTWSVVNVYQSIAVPLGVPLFLMLTGALLLQPEKIDTLSTFWKKRWARIGWPSLFWGAAYFAWDFLIQNIPFTSSAIIQGILNGPYTQLWYLYVLAGLYLLTPVLRVFITHADLSLIKYFLLIWAVGAAILPLIGLFTSYELNANVFTVTGYVGFFILGTYLSSIKLNRKILAGFIILGFSSTAIGTYTLAALKGGPEMYFFQQYFSPTVILTAIMAFLLLLTVKPFPPQKEDKLHLRGKVIRVISQNTLGIFFIHVMIIESFQQGYFGITINRDILNPIIEAPLLTVIVLFVSLGIILILKRLPYLKKIIGAMDA